MDKLPIDYILRFVIRVMWITSTLCSKEQEVCLRDTLKASCEENEVIQMEYAHYGRMSVGRCIPENAGYQMGCQEDVLGYLDSVCSGRHSCQLRLLDYLVPERQPCPQGLESYLQFRYNCISVHVSSKPCAGHPLSVSGTKGTLANFITGRTGLGSSECPWEIIGSPGQKIRLTLHDYGVWSFFTSHEDGAGVSHTGTRLPKKSDICHIYARVTEESTKNPITLCGGVTRERLVYLSKTSRMELALTNPEQTQQSSYFLIRYEIVGCPTYIPTGGAVILRHEDNYISVRCPDTGNEWRLSCDGRRWNAEGNVTNCTIKSEPSVVTGRLFDSALTWTQGVLIILIISMAILIAVIILVVGVVCLRRRRVPGIRSVSNPGKNFSPSKYASKEHYPMLPKNESARHYPPGKGYTTTAHRHTAMPKRPVAPSGQFPPLPPTPLFPDAQHSSIHGTMCHDRDRQANDDGTTKRTHTGHLRDSSQFMRSKGNEIKTKDHFYHELDPELTKCHIVSPTDYTDPGTEIPALNKRVTPQPDVPSAFGGNKSVNV